MQQTVLLSPASWVPKAETLGEDPTDVEEPHGRGLRDQNVLVSSPAGKAVLGSGERRDPHKSGGCCEAPEKSEEHGARESTCTPHRAPQQQTGIT